ncbi:MAG: FAD-dependent 5-carboxymethylaminomethyl-2-thiouridine(34) oxidoreductase MnmC [Planctomycetota bacterium]
MPNNHAEVRIHGAGLAGCSVAHALASRGTRVELVDPNGLAGGASGQRQAVFQPRPGGPTERDARLVRLGFHFTRALLARLDPDDSFWRECGVLHLATDRDAAERFARRVAVTEDPSDFVALDREGVRALLGPTSRNDGLEGGLWIPTAGTLEPRSLCRALIESIRSRIELRSTPSDREVEVQVLANGADASVQPGTERLAIRPTRGQATNVRATDLTALPFVLCNSGYATPADRDGLVTLAATYGHGDSSGEVRAEDDDKNLVRTRVNLHPLALSPEAQVVLGEAGVRATTADRMPLVGELPSDLRPTGLGAGRWFASLGHGSRGTATAPITGEWLASWILGEARDGLQEWVAPLRPARRARPPTSDDRSSDPT